MSSQTRTMAACLADAMDTIYARQAEEVAAADPLCCILNWQRAMACVVQREAMRIYDDPCLQALHDAEHEARLAAQSALTRAGVVLKLLPDMVPA